ncbi:MAG: SHOCT domain-containing protein [Clostridia bacterium]|nr:SHOCT domain-containing protein [Clostridia bacterium]
MDALFNLDGNVATLTVYEDHCVITGKKSFLGFLGGRAFDGSKEFYYADMTSVQYKKAGAFINGFIQFEYPGSHSGQNNFNSENTFIIMKGKTDIEQCEKAYQYIKERISFYKNQKNSPIISAISPAEELKKFKELLDSGIITQDEFNAKKKELLGL